jgi:hypothetical protein
MPSATTPMAARSLSPMRRPACAFVLALIVALALLDTGCGGSSATQSSSTTVHRPPATPTSPGQRAMFVGHAGLAFGTFHRYVYKPFKAGNLRNSANNKLAFAKAAAATTATADEVVAAKQAAGASTALRKLFAPLAALAPTLGALETNLKHGHPDPADIKEANRAIASIKQIGSAAGVKISERAPAVNPQGAGRNP